MECSDLIDFENLYSHSLNLVILVPTLIQILILNLIVVLLLAWTRVRFLLFNNLKSLVWY